VYLEGYNKWIFYFVLRDRWKKLKDRPGISKGLKNAELAHRSWVVSRSRHGRVTKSRARDSGRGIRSKNSRQSHPPSTVCTVQLEALCCAFYVSWEASGVSAECSCSGRLEIHA